MTVEVKGEWAPGTEAVVEAFAQNFSEYDEQGAALAVYKGGELLLSVYAGTRDRQGELPWQEDTCVNVFSAGKPLVAAVIMRLVEKQVLELDARVGDYWPEFASRGKESITVRQVLNHSSGLSAFHPRVKDPVIYDTASIEGLLAYETPWWEPGSKQGYSPFLYGWILATLARKALQAAGKTGGTDGASEANGYRELFQQEVAAPLGLTAYCGVPEHLHSKLADVAPLKKPLGSVGSASAGANSAALGQLMKADPRGVTNRAFTNPMTLMNSTNTSQWRNACIPAANCHTNAKSLARFYDALLHNRQWLGESVLQEFSGAASGTDAVAEAPKDAVLGVPLRFGLGFMLSRDVDDGRYGSLQGFGHPGAGGSLGYADPASGIGFGYVTARLGQSLLIDARAQRLIAALGKV
ncbi:serine hydrolase domain-containing protein [Gilvimarinus chinensis]|uniref:serine hydrolase domain-containing protein n=1 Tax=Gilvimarinus chinensis TaxID=396005 RepID=UPI0003736EB1|nr:serine hydrolase domain-containing protein [Gilvimarinus chinensis]